MIATYIYAIVHRASGEAYVGRSRTIAGRFRQHRRWLNTQKHHSPLLQARWDADGHAAFDFLVLETLHDEPAAKIKAAELEWIARVGLLNAMQPSSDLAGFTMRAAAKAIISEKMKAWFASDSDDARACLAKVYLHVTSEQFRETMKAYAIKRWANPADAARLTAGLVKARTDPAILAKRNRAIAAASSTPSAKAAKSSRAKSFWADPERSAAVREKRKQAWTPERRAARSAKGKAHYAAKKAAGAWEGSPEHQALKRAHADPAVTAKRNAARAVSNNSPEGKAAFAKRIKATWADPERAATIRANQKASWTPELRAAKSALLKARHAAKKAAKEAQQQP